MRRWEIVLACSNPSTVSRSSPIVATRTLLQGYPETSLLDREDLRQVALFYWTNTTLLQQRMQGMPITMI